MHNLNKEKIIIFALAIPLFVLSLFLVSLGDGLFAIGASSEYRNNTNNTETIYESRKCADGVCRDSGKKLIEFKGGDAECENYKSEDERMQCYSQNSQASYSCSHLEDTGEVEKCYERNGSPSFEQNQGGAGTLVVSNSVTVNGSRVYMNGFDCNGEHKVITGTNSANNTAMTFRDGSRDVEYGGSMSTGGNGTVILSEEGGIYFGSEVEYDEGNLNSEGLRGQTMTSHNNNNGMNLNKCQGMQVMANNNNLITIPDDGDDYDNNTDHPWYIENQREPYAAVEIEKGLEVNGDLKTDQLFFKQKRIDWSEQPIRGHFIFMYYDDGLVRDEQESCSETLEAAGEEGRYPRDKNASHPDQQTVLASEGGIVDVGVSGGGGGGSNGVGEGGYVMNTAASSNACGGDTSSASVVPYDATSRDALDLSRSDITWYGPSEWGGVGSRLDDYEIDTVISDTSTCGHYEFNTPVSWPQPTQNGINCLIVGCGGKPGNYICQAWDWCYTGNMTKPESCSGYFNNISGNDGYYGPEYYTFIYSLTGDKRTNVVRVDVEGLCKGLETCDGSGGFLWKPDSTRGGVAILLPSSFPDGCDVTINGEAPIQRRGRTNPDRPTFFFAKKGCDYGTSVDVQADCSDGVHSWTILSGCNRCD